MFLYFRKQEAPLHHVGDESTDQNNNITMTSEDLLQPGHVVKERWKVVSLFSLLVIYHNKTLISEPTKGLTVHWSLRAVPKFRAFT
jgi:hypothetical protein